MRPLRQVGARLLRPPRTSPRRAAPLFITAESSCIHVTTKIPPSVRFLHAEQAEVESPPAPAAKSAAFETPPSTESQEKLVHLVNDSDSTYHAALKAFNDLRARGLKLEEPMYLSLLYKASREGRYERVWGGYEAFLEDEKQGQVKIHPRAPTTWPRLTQTKMQMHRFVLWAMLDTQREKQMSLYYQSEVAGKYNLLGLHEADPFNFLLRMECTTKVMGEQDQGLRQRVETLLNVLDRLELRTSYSSTHTLFRLIFHRPEIFVEASTNGEVVEEGTDVDAATTPTAEEVGQLIIGYMERFPYALALDPKRISVAVSAAAAADQHEAAKQLIQHGATHHVPMDAGSFAHTVESAPDEASRLKIADLYMHAKEHELIYTTQDTKSSIINYLLLHAVLDGNFKHMMELLHEMQLYNNRASNRTVRELFKSIAQYRAQIRHPQLAAMHDVGGGTNDSVRKLAECPTIMELFERFPNVISPTVYSFSQGILQSLYAGDLAVALDLMRAALWAKDVTLRPEIYSQLLYPLLAGGQRGGDEFSDASVFDRLEVERCFDRQHPKSRVLLNSLVVNICQSNDDLSTMLVCLDRWQGQRHPPMSRRLVKRVFEVISKQIQRLQKGSDKDTRGTAFIVDGMQLSYLAFMLRYRRIIVCDAWTLERAIVRARTCGLHADVVALLAEADAGDLVLNSAAYIVSLSVLEEEGEPSAVVACVEKMKANGAWEYAVSKDPEVQQILNRASTKLEEETQELETDPTE
ncbi:hypothetical protein PRIC2_001499 [Phytophthora ramorum]